MTAYPEPTVRVTRYAVNCVPEDNPLHADFEVTVEYRGQLRWAVLSRYGARRLRVDGTWSHNCIPETGRDEWLAAHCFDSDTALRMAREAAPRMTYGTWSVSEAIRRTGEGRQ